VLDSPFSTDPIRIGGVAFSAQDLGIIGVSIVIVVLLWLFFRYTKLGLGLRAAAVNPVASRLVGVRVGTMLAFGWGLAAVLGAVAGMMAAPPLGSFDQNLMQPLLLYAFAAAVLGGIDSPLGAVVGGLAIGVIVNLAGAYIDFVGADLRLPVALLVILVVLLVRPAGLFGHEAVRRV
jgi:branched-chain amino acid transport system permease protein